MDDPAQAGRLTAMFAGHGIDVNADQEVQRRADPEVQRARLG
jgi:hypothetical protein